MQVQRIGVPVEARGSVFGSVGCWLSHSPDVASTTHRPDAYTGFPAAGQKSAWVAIPVTRDVLLAAWMIYGMKHTFTDELVTFSADEVRETALWSLMDEGGKAAQNELDSRNFAPGYRACGPEVAEYFTLLAARLDEAFGFDAPTTGAPVPADPVDEDPPGVVGKWTGRTAAALRAASRMSGEGFAARLGIAPRTVANWEARPDLVPGWALQECLDTVLRTADPDTRERFHLLTATAARPAPAPVARRVPARVLTPA
jgi:hypothetical protein